MGWHMTFLPVAQRELLAASRRKATFRMRTGSAIFAAILTFIMLLFVSATGAGARSGQFLFNTLVAGGHIFAVLAGVFLTADGISEERRDGTLGFLFLTDLTGLDIIAGKFTGLVLSAFFGLASVFPVLAISWFMGGVSNGEFWRNCVAMLNQLFFAACVGLAMSARETRQARAVGKTLILVGFFSILLPTALSGLHAAGAHPRVLIPALLSPTAVIDHVGESAYLRDPSTFFLNLGVSHLLGWAFLISATWAVSQGWRLDAARPQRPTAAMTLDRRVLDSSPLGALMGMQKWPQRVAWFAGGTTVLIALASAFGLAGAGAGGFKFPLLLGILVRGLMAWEVTSFIGECRRSGSLELILTTPLRDADVTRAVIRHLTARYLAPVLLMMVTALAGAIPNGLFVPSLIDAIGAILQIIAIPAVGVWFGLTEPKPMVAFAKTFGFVVVLSTPLNFVCCVGFVIPPLMSAWAQSKLRLPFRDILAGVRSHWQRRDGWLHSTGSNPAPPPLPYVRED
jgi:ABC-type transport system involved in multi-copper enzyme maturation permease subunit